MFTATSLQAATYLLGVCLFSISFLVFLNSSVSFVITDIIKEQYGVGNAVGTLGFADELLALVACPLWGVLSDRVGVRTVCVLGYTVVGLALFIFVQAKNVFPQLLLARLFFSVGGAATTTMVTAILPSMTATETKDTGLSGICGQTRSNGHVESPSVSSELTVTPSRLRIPTSKKSIREGGGSRASPTRLAGIVGMFTGCGALVALGLFLPLPTQFRKLDVSAGQALADTYYLVGGVALLIALLCFLGLRRLKGEEGKTWRAAYNSVSSGTASEGHDVLPYHILLIASVRLGLENRLIGLGYLGGFVARASSVGISLFIPLYVNHYFISSGICQIDDPVEAKAQCHEAYILAAKLTGTSQLVALLFAPVFGYLADKYRQFHIPLLLASVSGIIGYVSFASLKSPESHGKSGSPLVYVVVALLGISQIGCIVCSLGLLGRAISGLEDQDETSISSDSGRVISQAFTHGLIGTTEQADSIHGDAPITTNLPDEACNQDHESAGLLGGSGSQVVSRNHLKGSIAGVYSLAGGAGILLLTKLGGILFDTRSPASPFYMLSLFNLLLLTVGMICGAVEIVQIRNRSR